MSRQCLLDMDGVLADFVTGSCEVHNRPSPYDDPSNFSRFDIEKIWGISWEDFWRPIMDENYFWHNLDQMPEADTIVEMVFDLFDPENVAVLTHPHEDDPNCVPGKRAWILRHYPALDKQMIFGGAKSFLSGPERVLIDDKDENVVDFIVAGGQAVLVPHPWNSAYERRAHTVSSVRAQLNDITTNRRLKDGTKRQVYR